MTDNKKQKHPWRSCPIGEHWVKEHPRKVNISDKNPTGVTIVDAHCKKNWMEAIAEYKGILSQLGRFAEADRIMAAVDNYYKGELICISSLLCKH